MTLSSNGTFSPELHTHTPILSSLGHQGFLLRTVQYCRSEVGGPTEARIERNGLDAAQRIAAQWDARLWAKAQAGEPIAPNLRSIYDLGGRVLASDSVDAGWKVSLFSAAAKELETWDSRGNRRAIEYDDQLRPVALFEQAHNSGLSCTERFTYAGSTHKDIQRNRCGQLIRHDDPAGSKWHETFGISGMPSNEIRRFCGSLMSPNWPEPEVERETLLEDRSKIYATHWGYDGLGAVIHQTDALGHVQSFELDVAGRPYASYLDGVALLKSTLYNAFGEVEFEQAGNNVITTAVYSEDECRLCTLKTSTQSGKVLQNLHYQYDPLGNIERIEDTSQPVQWFAQQRIEDVSTYTYDTLYQLKSATGRENARQTVGPGLPELETFGTQDDSRWRNYTQTYSYDSGGNLNLLKHDAGTGNTYKREMVVDELSNRSLTRDSPHVEFALAFDVNGNQQILSPGQIMQWNTRNQLHQVTQVQRDEPDGQDDDVEIYIYDGNNQRVRKVRRAKTHGAEQLSEVRYLHGLEIRTRNTSEQLHIVIAQAGRSDVRWLHWSENLPKNIPNDQFRYSLSNHLGSSTLELDEGAELISQESYYPYGGTAWWAARSVVEAKYKTVRYSGKERDATGLYYYGSRYYAPWLQRWINPDPVGVADGLNLYGMVKNDPINSVDKRGETRERALANWEKIRNKLRRRDNQVPGAEYLFENVLDPASQTKNSRRYKGVIYLDEHKRNRAAITFEHGSMYFANKQLSTLSNADTWVSSNTWHKHMYGYVLAFNKAGDRKMYIFKPVTDQLHHSSAMAGERVIDAGMLVVTEGRVAYIENKSGHYKPHMEQKLQTLKFLQDQGMDLQDTFISNRKPSRPGQEQTDFFMQHLYSATEFYKHYTTGRNQTRVDPRRLMSGQRETIERLTARSWVKVGPNSRAKNIRTHGHELA